MCESCRIEAERLTMSMLTIADMARREANAGGPANMVARYVDAEVRHAIADHGVGRGVDCIACLQACWPESAQQRRTT